MFYFPFAFIFIIPCFFALYKFRSNRKIINVLRIILCFILILSIAQPSIQTESLSGIVIVIADRSESMTDESEENQIEIIKHIQEERTEGELLGVIGFDGSVFIEKMPDLTEFSGFRGLYNTSGSALYKAIKLARSLIPDDRNGRVILLSDGRTTGANPYNIIMQNDISVPIDYFVIQDPLKYDLSIQEINLPDFAERGEAFQFSAEVYSPVSGVVEYALDRNNVVIGQGKMELDAGINRMYFRDSVISPGNTIYTLQVKDINNPDSVMENNTAKGVLTVRGVKPILYIGHENSNLIKVAELGGIKLDFKDITEVDWSLNSLAGYRAVILENVPGTEIGYTGLLSLNMFVKETGGGLFITGGRQSYGRGGYFNSPLDEIFPVSMELKQHHRKLLNAVVIALDRSGSMSQMAGDGLMKIDLANKGSASVLELLSDYDSFGLIAVDTAAFTIVPFYTVGSKRSNMLNSIYSIDSQGGGIYIYNALIAASNMIKDADAATKHIILFADATDSEEPGGYANLVPLLNDTGITVSVIGLGNDTDIDAGLLMHIAELGGGQVYFTSEPKELPLLFTQDAMIMFKGSFIEEQTNIRYADEISLLMDIKDTEIKPIGGYNPCYLKPGASIGMYTDDDEQLPILAFWQVGNGRSIAFTGEIDGPYSGPFAEDAGDFYLSILRWINIDNSNDEELYAVSRREGNSVYIRLELDPGRIENPFSGNPNLIKLVERDTIIETKVIPLRWIDKDTLGYIEDIDENGINHFYVQVDDKTIQCASYTIPYSIEFKLEEDKNRGVEIMERLSEFTGGTQRLSIDGVYDDIPKSQNYVLLTPLLAFFAIFILLLDIYLRRIGFSWVRKSSLVIKLKNRKAQKEKIKADKKNKKQNPSDKESEEQSVIGAIRNIKKKRE